MMSIFQCLCVCVCDCECVHVCVCVRSGDFIYLYIPGMSQFTFARNIESIPSLIYQSWMLCWKEHVQATQRNNDDHKRFSKGCRSAGSQRSLALVSSDNSEARVFGVWPLLSTSESPTGQITHRHFPRLLYCHHLNNFWERLQILYQLQLLTERWL